MRLSLFLSLLILCACKQDVQEPVQADPIGTGQQTELQTPFLVVLGTIQDAGSPQIGCQKACCRDLFDHPDPNRMRTSLGLVDPVSGSSYLFEATPDIGRQLHLLQKFSRDSSHIPTGIFLTHAHIGHYTGLQFLGKEAINADQTPVFSMPRMKEYLTNNGPWEQLLSNRNITLKPLQADSVVKLSDNLRVIPFLVPHRDEYSETVGYLIEGPEKSALFIPDIDKWDRWDRSITELVKQVDVAYLDATFYHGQEIAVRDISQIPHPFIEESMELFRELSSEDRSKINFIHFNHTNPVLLPNSIQYQTVLDNGFNIAQLSDVVPL